MYGDHTVIDGYLFPRRLVIRQPSPRAVMVAAYEHVALNSGLGAGDFELPIPEGTEIIDVP